MSVDAAQETREAPQRVAVLLEPTGRVAYEVPLPDPEPWEFEHAGYLWRWSHRRALRVTYERGRVVTKQGG